MTLDQGLQLRRRGAVDHAHHQRGSVIQWQSQARIARSNRDTHSGLTCVPSPYVGAIVSRLNSACLQSAQLEPRTGHVTGHGASVYPTTVHPSWRFRC
jgi:hypothetical protein